MKRAPFSMSRMACDLLERVGARLAEDDVVRLAAREDVADVVQCGREAGFADDVCRSSRSLVGEELRGRHGRGPDGLLGHVDATGEQAGPQIPCREDRVVREDEEGTARGLERFDEVGGSGDRVLLVHEDAVHVGEPGLDRLRLSHPAVSIHRSVMWSLSRLRWSHGAP
jgi:hypothetical protein